MPSTNETLRQLILMQFYTAQTRVEEIRDEANMHACNKRNDRQYLLVLGNAEHSEAGLEELKEE